MAEFPTYEEMGKRVTEEALDGYIYKGKTLREWIDKLSEIPTGWIIREVECPYCNETHDADWLEHMEEYGFARCPSCGCQIER